MKEIATILKNNTLYPFGETDLEILREFKPNSILRVKLSGVKKPRSYLQLKLYWSGCKLVSENTEDIHWNTKEKVDFQCRVATHFVDPDCVVVKRDGSVHFSYRSISFANLQHIDACNYFDQAFKVMAKFLMIPVETLMEQIYSQ